MLYDKLIFNSVIVFLTLIILYQNFGYVQIQPKIEVQMIDPVSSLVELFIQECDQHKFLRALHHLTPNSKTIIVVGANVGDLPNDQLFHMMNTHFNDYQKVFIEPIKPIFKQLEKNVHKHKMKNTLLVNAAIGDKENKLTFYCWKGKDEIKNPIIKSKYKWWWDQTCSLDYERLFSSYDFGPQLHQMLKDLSLVRELLETDIAQYSVPVYSFKQLIVMYNLDPHDIAYIQVDTEGYDAVVVKNILETPNVRPVAINYEDMLLSEQDKASVSLALRGRGYSTPCKKGGPSSISFIDDGLTKGCHRHYDKTDNLRNTKFTTCGHECCRSKGGELCYYRTDDINC